MDDIPPINSLVEVIVDEDRIYRSRVEEVEDRLLSVAAPMGAGDLEPPRTGAPLDLAWVKGPSRYVLPVRLSAITKRPTRLWQVEVAGKPSRQNRRNFVRGGGGESVQISRYEEEDDPPLSGHVVDISEGGIRIRLEKCPYRPGDQVQVKVTLGSEVIEARGTVLGQRPSTNEESTEVVSVLVLTEAQARTVRRYVLEWQVAERRLRRDED